MLQVYDLGMRIARRAILSFSRLRRKDSPAKLSRFANGQRHILKTVEENVKELDHSRPTIWIHASSLGEFGISRPIIKVLKENFDCNIVMTFFSPTGYEAVSKNHPNIDKVFYLPFDTDKNARRFLDAVKPDCAVFMVSEYWHSYLYKLKVRGIPAFLVSAVIRDNSPFFKWYGDLYRKSISYFKRVFVLDGRSKENLESLGITNSVINGDPLFDNVNVVASTPWHDEKVERFANGKQIFIAGSIHNDQDLEIIAQLVNKHTDIKFIIAPHEIDNETLNRLRELIDGNITFYSQCDKNNDLGDCQVLVIDFVGALAYLYRYASWAYVGGGFTKLLHSIIEPAAYGMPVAFGPNIQRKAIAKEMIEHGVGTSIRNFKELDRWFCQLKSNPYELKAVSEKAAKYVTNNTGATPRVVKSIGDVIWAKK
ncbi:MAG: polysaccharide pyruvyl transferase family protein [Muribaculum sp.]|nr:polysaccharide pyruvyl transferase family protein [Muribaculum sp.]